jgi:hypothetical protein
LQASWPFDLTTECSSVTILLKEGIYNVTIFNAQAPDRVSRGRPTAIEHQPEADGRKLREMRILAVDCFYGAVELCTDIHILASLVPDEEIDAVLLPLGCCSTASAGALALGLLLMLLPLLLLLLIPAAISSRDTIVYRLYCCVSTGVRHQMLPSAHACAWGPGT